MNDVPDTTPPYHFFLLWTLKWFLELQQPSWEYQMTSMKMKTEDGKIEKEKACVFYGICISKDIHQLDMQQ